MQSTFVDDAHLGERLGCWETENCIRSTEKNELRSAQWFGGGQLA